MVLGTVQAVHAREANSTYGYRSSKRGNCQGLGICAAKTSHTPTRMFAAKRRPAAAAV